MYHCDVPLLIGILLINVDRLEGVVGTAMGVDCALARDRFRYRRLTSLVVLILALAWTGTVVSQGDDVFSRCRGRERVHCKCFHYIVGKELGDVNCTCLLNRSCVC